MSDAMRSIFDASEDVVFVTSPEGRVLDINGAGLKLCESGSVADLAGFNFPRDLIADIVDRKFFQRMIDDGGVVRNFAVEFRKMTGETHQLLFDVYTRYETGKAVYRFGFIRDVSLINSYYRRLEASEKMVRAASVAGGVAYNLNVSVSKIMELLQQAKGNVGMRDEMILYCNRAFTLSRGLLSVMGKQVMVHLDIGLNSVVKDISGLLHMLLGEKVELESHLSDNELIVNIDRGQLECLLIDVCLNLRDIMKNKTGVVSIKTDTIYLGQHVVDDYGFGFPGVYAVLSVAPAGEKSCYSDGGYIRAAGLGLSDMTERLSAQHCYIDADSVHGTVCAVKVYLPLERGSISGLIDMGGAGAGNILFADDDVAVYGILVDLLRKAGYGVVLVHDGESAVGAFTDSKQAIDLCVFDVLMPRLNGREAFMKIREMKPDARVIFISGHTADVALNGLKGDGVYFVKKPLDTHEFLCRVKDILSAD